MPPRSSQEAPVVGEHYLDAKGETHTRKSVEDPDSPAYKEEAANATHIPYPEGLPPPGGRRVAVPNVVALPDWEGSGDG